MNWLVNFTKSPKMKMLKTICLFLALASSGLLRAQKPNWTVDAKAFQFSMNITGSFFENCNYAGEKGDLIGAFSGETLRGVSEISDVINGNAIAFLTVFSDVSLGEDISFKRYRSKQGDVINLDIIVPFTEGGILGAVAEPYRLTLGESFVVPDIEKENDSLFINEISSSYASYQWFSKENGLLKNEINPFLNTSEIGDYGIKIITAKGCEITVGEISFSVGLEEINNSNRKLSVFPNPVADKLSFSKKMNEIEVKNSSGILVLNANNQDVIDVSVLKSGVYFVKTEEGMARFVKE